MATPDAARGGVKRLLLFVCIAVAGLAVGYFTPLRDVLEIERVRSFAMGLGWWGPLVIVAVAAVGPLVFLPRWPVCFLCGLLYGVVWGSLLGNIASVLGAWVHYLVARSLLAPGSVRMLRRWQLDPSRIPGEKAFSVLLLLRAFPLSNSAATNVLAGALRLSLGGYLLATFLGMIPSTVLYASWGKLLKRPEPGFYYLAVGILVLVAVGTLWAGRRLVAYRQNPERDQA
jgi:uncharacterized membrane protein YdjX (TVP38/TMEM64 family)